MLEMSQLDLLTSQRSLWGKLHLALYEMSAEKYQYEHVDLKVYLAIIMQAAHDRDFVFFKTPDYEKLCELLEIDDNFMYDCIQRTWTHYDTVKLKTGRVNQRLPLFIL